MKTETQLKGKVESWMKINIVRKKNLSCEDGVHTAKT